MLTLIIPEEETYDDEKEVFGTLPKVVLELEHSLVSLSKWEEKYEKPLLSNVKDLKASEVLYYVKCMSLKPVSNKDVSRITNRELEVLRKYLERKATATWFAENEHTRSTPVTTKKIITSEVIYHWMVSLQIPFECQHWNLNRLITLIKVCQIESQPPKKMSRAQAAAQHKSLNAQRRAAINTGG